MDSLGRFISIVLAIILILIYPLQYVAGFQVVSMDHMTEHYTEQFTDKVRKEGSITQEVYEEYLNKLSLTGELYDIEIEHARPKTAGDIISEYTLPGVLLASVDKNYLPVTGMKLISSTIEASGNISTFATHIHTDDCYDGTKHVHSGKPTSRGGCYTGARTREKEECDGYYSDVVTLYEYECDTCGYTTEYVYGGGTDCGAWIWDGAIQKQCDGSLYYTGKSTTEYRCDECSGYSTNPNDYNKACTSTVYKDYYALSCGKTEGAYYDASGNLVSPICHLVVTSITGKNQTITEGQDIDTTALATFLNGTTGIVNCTATGFDKNKVGTQTVTLTYSGKVGNAKTSGTRTTTITVTVLASLQSITVVPSATTVYNGTEPTYTVKAHYGNGNSKTLTSAQYKKTGWSSGPGRKTVTFSYTESGKTVTASVTITVKPNVSKLEVTPSSITVYNGAKPTFTVKVIYENNTSITLTSSQYVETGWSSGPGRKTVTFSYTENSKTVSSSVAITVKPNITSISVAPSTQTIERYQNPSFTVRVNYEDGTSTTTTAFYISGFNNRNIGSQTATISYSENGITKTTSTNVKVTHMSKVCSVCGTRYYLDDNDVDQGCPVCKSTLVSISVTPKEITLFKGENLPITVKGVFRNGHVIDVTGWSSDFDPYRIGVQQVTVTYQGLKEYITVIVKPNEKVCPVCNATYPLNPDGTDPGCPYCKTELIGIDVQPKEVTIEMYRPIPITVTAIYRDGHTEVVSDWTSNLLPNRAGVFDVTINYKNQSEMIKVTVLNNDINICPYCGYQYSRTEFRQGCPECAKVIVAIEARLRNGGSQVPIGTDLNLEVVLIYRHEYRELVYSGYEVSNYNPSQLGQQTVTVHYGSLQTNLTIEVIDNFTTVTCENGHNYHLNQDGSDPGCPYCHNDIADMTILYYEITYTNEIIGRLYEHGRYDMKKGDYITVTVTNRKTSLRSNIQKIFMRLAKEEKRMAFGGEVSGGTSS